MSRFMGSRTADQPPPHIKKTAGGRPPVKANKYTNVRPSEQRNTAGQKRVRREKAWRDWVEKP
jgi:hypothetical protein